MFKTLLITLVVTMITPPSSGTQLPENVDPETLDVTLDSGCEIAMRMVGCTADGHEYKCNAMSGYMPKVHRLSTAPRYSFR